LCPGSRPPTTPQRVEPLLLKAVSKHTDLRWVVWYVERLLEAPLQRPDGTLVARDRGTPQGSAISTRPLDRTLEYRYEGPWCLPGPDPHRLADESFRSAMS
jgi:RNA-directed DNA polymerase